MHEFVSFSYQYKARRASSGFIACLLMGGGCELQEDTPATTTLALPTKREHPHSINTGQVLAPWNYAVLSGVESTVQR
jgi:hypothetical protein